MKNVAKLIMILAILLVLPLAALAAPIGKISALEGRVDITVGNQARDAKLGEPISAGDILRAKSKSKAEVTFSDGNILRLAENTRVRVSAYPMEEGRTSTMDLSRGKIQNIVTGLARNARYEVRTPTAICGVRGTTFIAFFEGGVSGFVPKEGTIYGYNRTMPQDVKVVTAGQAIIVQEAAKPATIQPATSMEVDKHVADTTPTQPTEGEKKEEEKQQGGPPPPPPPPPPPLPEPSPSVGEDGWDDDYEPDWPEDKIDYWIQPTATELQVDFGSSQGALAVDTGTGTIGLALQYTETEPGSGVYNTPQPSVGGVTGTISDGSMVDGYLAGVPGSWMGAVSGIYRRGTGAGLILGSLTGTYNAATGLLTASGGLTRTADLLTITSGAEPLYSPEPITLFGVSAIKVGADGAAYITPGGAELKANNFMVMASETGMIGAWALDNLNGEGATAYENLSGRTVWTAKYGYSSSYGGYYNPEAGEAPHFILGNITGTQDSLGHLQLSGRGLLYMDPNQMGYVDIEYWRTAAGLGTGAGIIQARPLAFGGYWGYDMNCLYMNDGGYLEHIGDEWGLVGSWTAPWTAPAVITAIGAYVMDNSGYGNYPAYLWNSPISSRGYADDFYYDPVFSDGEFYGITAGRIGRSSATGTGIVQRSAQGDMAVLYFKDGKAGVLTTFAPGSAGGLTGAFYPGVTGDDGFWRMDGTLTATPLETRTGLTDFTLRDAYNDVTLGYKDGSSYVNGSGNNDTFHFAATDPQQERTFDLPWGIYSLELEGYPSGSSNGFQSATGNPAGLSGKAIKIGGSGYDYNDGQTYWLGDIKDTVWTAPVDGAGEIKAKVEGDWISEYQMGTFGGPFSGLYNEAETGAGYGSWVGSGVGTYQGTDLSLNGNIYGSLKAYTPGTGGDSGMLDYLGGTHGLLGAASNPLAGPAPVLLMGDYSVYDPESYHEPALMYGSGWYLSGRLGLDTVPGTGTGAHNGYIVGLWNGGLIESARILSLYNGPGGKAGYLYGTATGNYYDSLQMWKAKGTLTAVEFPGVTTTLDVAAYDSLISGYFSGYASAASASYTVAADVVEGAMLGLKDQAVGWGIWNMGLGGTYTGAPPANFTARIGGWLGYSGSTYNSGYWTGNLNTAWGAANRLTATLTSGRFLTPRYLGEMVTGPYGGILGSWSAPVSGTGTWQAAGLGTYASVKPLDIAGNGEFSLSRYVVDGGIGSFESAGSAYALFGGTDGAPLATAGQPAASLLMGHYSGGASPALFGYYDGYPFSLAAATRQLTEDTADDGALRLNVAGIWHSGMIEATAKALGLYVRADGKAGYLYGNLGGSYFPNLSNTGELLWVADMTGLTAGPGSTTSATAETLDSHLVTGTLSADGEYSDYGGIAGTGNAAGFVTRALMGQTAALDDQNWGVWSLAAGGSHAGTLPASFTARAGGDFYSYGDPGTTGYWLGTLDVSTQAATGLLTASLTGGRVLTDMFLADISTNRGGIVGSFDADTWQAIGVGSYENLEPLAFSSKLDGHIGKMVPGMLKGTEYSALYRLPSGSYGDTDFWIDDQNRFLRVRYQGIYFDDGVDANRGVRFEEFEGVQTGYVTGFTQVWQEREDYWYTPDGFFTSSGKGPQVYWGNTAYHFPNLNLAASTVTGGYSGTHPHLPGTVGSAASFPADYDPYTVSGGTFIPTYDFTYPGANSSEQIGSFGGLLGARGGKMALWTDSASSAPVNLTFLGTYVHAEGYTGPAYQGTLGFGSSIGAYVDAGGGYSGAYFGFLAGLLPDTGSPLALEGNLYALYLANTAQGSKAGIIQGTLTTGKTYPEIGMWQADGTMYRIAGMEFVNTSEVNPVDLLIPFTQQASDAVVMGRAGVEGTAGFYNPAGARALAFGSGWGWSASIYGLSDFGIFTLRHGFMNLHENASTATTWETAGWAEFGQYMTYRDFGYWYATLKDKSWANNRLTGTLDGEFLTLKKWGVMHGQMLGVYDSSGIWGASSQGYWLKSQDLAFSSLVGGTRYQLRHEIRGSAWGETAEYYYWFTDPADPDRYGGSSYTDSSGTTIQRFDRQGPGNDYYNETWTTADGGQTWSYAKTAYPSEASYIEALDSLATILQEFPEYGEEDGYYFNDSDFSGIMGGLNTQLWSEKVSPLKFRGNFGVLDDEFVAPLLVSGKIASFSPDRTLYPESDSTSPIGGAYFGLLGLAVDKTLAISGGLVGLYMDDASGVLGGYCGVFYTTALSGRVRPAVGDWSADGSLALYQMTGQSVSMNPADFAQSIVYRNNRNAYEAGVDVIAGGTPATRIVDTTTASIPGMPWGIWQTVAGGTYTGGLPSRWISLQEEPVQNGVGLSGATVLDVQVGAPLNGIASGSVAGAQARSVDPVEAGIQAYTVVLGGEVKGLFNPATTPLTGSWQALMYGGSMEAGAFLAKQSSMNDAARANFEKAMKIPAFDVGMANLAGNNGNLYVNMDGIKFFRFQSEADPRIWATNQVYGTYRTEPVVWTPGAKVTLTSSGGLAGLTHTFEVTQWNTANGNTWGAEIYKGATGTSGILMRSTIDQARVPGAPSTIPVTEMRGVAAGMIQPGIPGANGPNSFVGTAAGTVRTTAP